VTIGGSIALIVIGAILKYAISWQPNGIDLPLVGLILMIAGIAGLIISLALTISKNRRRGAAQVYEERRFTEPPN
jgi:Domain of unknown function (DUF6458)